MVSKLKQQIAKLQATRAYTFMAETISEFAEHNCMRKAASLAFYTALSLPPMLVVIMTVSGLLFQAEAIEGKLADEVSSVAGKDGASQIRTMVEAANRPGQGLFAKVIGIVMLVIGASAVFAELQDSLNNTWEVKPDPEQGGIKNFILTRLLSFGMVLGLAFLLMLSVTLSAIVSAASKHLGGWLPGGISAPVAEIVNNAVSLVIFTLLFAAIFKILPDAKIGWRDVWTGAAVTAVLFLVGKFAIGMYLGSTDMESAYGAAGSIILVLLWVYYSSMILFYGAVFTRIWAKYTGSAIRPDNGAIHVATHTSTSRTEAVNS